MGQQQELAAVLKAPAAAMVFSWEPIAVTTTKPADAEAHWDMPPTKAPPAARRLSVPPPPGRAVARSLSSSRAVRPEDDPFLAAYLACTKSTRGGGEPNKQGRRRRFTWARLGLSCKGSAGVVERTMVKGAKRPEPEEVDPTDA